MKNNYIRIILIVVFVVTNTLSFGQVKQINPPKIVSPFKLKKIQPKSVIIKPNDDYQKTSQKTKKVETINGSFMLDFKNQNNELAKKLEVAKANSSVSIEFNTWFGLDENHTFKLSSTKTDELKITHYTYKHFFKGILVEGSFIMINYKNDDLYSANGQIAEFKSIETNISITEDTAKKKAAEFTKVKNISNFPIETLISRIPSSNGFEYKLAYKVRFESFDPFIQKDIYVDASNGNILNTISLIAHVDTPANANTLYSGTQTITSDSYNGSYRLKDNLRNIQTFDATNATDLALNNSTDITNSNTTWGTYPSLTSFTITNISQNWWYSAIGDTSPDLYIIVKNSSNTIVYNGRNFYFNNTFPTVTISNLSIPMTSQPYTVEIWDYDPVGGDDFGGSYTISSASNNWSVNGNSGSYIIQPSVSNPALDVHWGMEKTYDFYKNVFNRTSYDNNGSIIKNYLNPPFLQSTSPLGTNNAFAMTSDVMVYGLGDGIDMKPVVGLDVEGHEFSHMVVKYNGNGGLAYQSESGALNESFADILGTCVEFYAKPSTANWTIGEDVIIPTGNCLRSMSNPNLKNQPDTYKGLFWLNPNCGTPSMTVNDYCGVHTNSGVQNFWFYLLCNGGTGTNDLNNAYSVSGIGIAQARAIVYRNLTTYLGSNATYMSAYLGSLQAAQDLYGTPSSQYSAVRQAWYAVGIGNDPNLFCSGVTNLTTPTGTFTDGSGALGNYLDNSSCKWVIAPQGATQISINFTSFNTEATYDTVTVYNGPDDTFPVLATWWGNTLPATISTSVGIGAMCVKFTTDSSTNYTGWSATYNSIITAPACSGGNTLTTPTGTISDGSSSSNYTNNQLCYWYIAPPCATSITLNFSELATELNYDGVVIYDSLSATNQLGIYSGNTLPSSITSSTGAMLVVFISDYSTTSQGFTANYTSNGSSYCSGTTIVNSSDYGTISDGSGVNNYCNNSNCTWLIQPPQASSISLRFTELDLENAPSQDGYSIADAVEIYDGNSASAPLLGRFSGNNIPSQIITSTGGSIFIKFYSDVSVTKQGWSINYISTQNQYCNGTTTLTTPSASFSDGSGANKYANNSNCSWLIQPPSASSITLSFSTFDTELNFDGVIVYNGINSSAPVLGQFSGTSIPSSVTSTGGSMYVVFLSDEALRSNGWNASYTSTTLGINDFNLNENIKIYPNPTSGIFTIQSSYDNSVSVQLFDVLGKQVLKSYTINKGLNIINASDLSKGIYLLKLNNELGSSTQKLIIK